MKFIFLALVSMFSILAFAELKTVPDGTPEQQVSFQASSVYSVNNFQIGKYAYKLVRMDSQLNGDLTETTILLVGEGAAGGAAGYNGAFIITPTVSGTLMRNMKVVKNQILFTLSNIDGKVVKKSYRYDSVSNSLKEPNEK